MQAQQRERADVKGEWRNKGQARCRGTPKRWAMGVIRYRNQWERGADTSFHDVLDIVGGAICNIWLIGCGSIWYTRGFLPLRSHPRFLATRVICIIGCAANGGWVY